MRKITRYLLAIVTALVAVLLIAAAGPKESEAADENTKALEKSLTEMTREEIDAEVELTLEDVWFELPEGEIKKEKSIFNILLLGTDLKAWETDTGRADATMLCSLNIKTGEIKLVSFERGVYVPIPNHAPDLLTHAFQYGGANLSRSLLEHLFLVGIDGYAQVDFESFPEIVDLIGGVDIELTETEVLALQGKTLSNAHAHNEIQVGMNHLDGKDTLAYCRLRFPDDDWARQERQRNTLKACQKQLKTLNPIEMLKVLRGAADMVNTDLDGWDISRLLLHAGKLSKGEVGTMQVPDKNRFYDAIACDFVYETKKISNFIYGTEYEIESPYVNVQG